jgi:hypothetical protein
MIKRKIALDSVNAMAITSFMRLNAPLVGADNFAKNEPGQHRHSNGALMGVLNGDSTQDFERKLFGTPVLAADSFFL